MELPTIHEWMSKMDHCKICHASIKEIPHWCELSKVINVGGNILKIFYREINTDATADSSHVNTFSAEIMPVFESGLEMLPIPLKSKTTRDSLSEAFRWIRLNVINQEKNPDKPKKYFNKQDVRHNIPSISTKFKVEEIFKMWAILILIPDEGIPCQNIRPLDLVLDKESLFASCDSIKQLKSRKIEQPDISGPLPEGWRRYPSGKIVRYLTETEVANIKKELADGISAANISDKYAVNPLTIYNIKHGRTHRKR